MSLLLKRIVSILLAFVFILTTSGALSVYAKPSPSPTLAPEINSFEFFWPLAAGKTQGESLYSLKRFKENVRGWFIFSPIKKADYLAFLATKRVLEAEKLAKEVKVDLAKKTINQATVDIENSDASLVKSTKAGEEGSLTKSSLAEKLNKLETFLKWFQTSQPDLESETTNLLEKVMTEAGKL